MAVYQVIGVGEHGKYFDEYSYHDTIGYILGHAVYAGYANVSCLELAAEEMLAHAVKWNKNSLKRVRHSILSFDQRDHVTPDIAAEYGMDIIQYYADNYQIVFAVHNNTDQVHIHFVMNQIGLDGKRYRGQKKDYHDFLKWMHIKTGNLPIIPVKG